MKKDQNELEEDEALRNRLIYGVHFTFEGGEEDDTIRPTTLSPEALKALKESCPPAEYFNDPTDQKFSDINAVK
jgi:hypothetical protein